MDFFNSAIDVLQTLVIALGAGLDVYKRQVFDYVGYGQHVQFPDFYDLHAAI